MASENQNIKKTAPLTSVILIFYYCVKNYLSYPVYFFSTLIETIACEDEQSKKIASQTFFPIKKINICFNAITIKDLI